MVSMRPRELPSNDKLFYSSRQLAQDKRVVELHADVSPVYQVLLPAADIVTRPDDADSFHLAPSYRDLSFVTYDLCQTLFDFLGKHIVQPRRDIFEKATGLRVTAGDQASGFLTQFEAESAMEEARRQDLIHQILSRFVTCNA